MKKTRPCPGCGGPTHGQLCQPCRRARRTRSCEGCGGSFTSRELTQRFCSLTCYQASSGHRAKRRECEVCGAGYTCTYTEQRTCGRACGAELRRREGSYTENGRYCDRCGRQAGSHSHVAALDCSECGRLFIARGKQLTCSSRCSRQRTNRVAGMSIMMRYHSDPAFREKVNAAAHLRRADKLGVADDAIRTMTGLITYLMKRDRGRCGICRKPVRAAKGPMRPSVDHIVPLAKGGAHELANLQLAHYWCNLSKNDRGGGEQLLLIG